MTYEHRSAVETIECAELDVDPSCNLEIRRDARKYAPVAPQQRCHHAMVWPLQSQLGVRHFLRRPEAINSTGYGSL